MPKHKFAIKYCCATHNTVVWLTVTCTSTAHRNYCIWIERMVSRRPCNVML